MADKIEQANATVAFTLPIACSVCLGKVKQPVLCPNNHVFCRSCMDVWLQRNNQCPACRVEITLDNPCKPIIGGLAHKENEEKFSNPELRKARFDLLYKEYEEEIDRLESKLKAYKKENKDLRSKLDQKSAAAGGDYRVVGSPSDAKLKKENGDSDLRKKLRDNIALYEKIKKEVAQLKQENNRLKDGNVDLTHENQRLRVEIANRSPQRYGRYTMAALQTKVDNYEKDIKKLQRALERSDVYVEELQEENERLKNGERVTPKERKDIRERDLEISYVQSPKDLANSSGVKRKLNLGCPKTTVEEKFMSPSKKSNISFGLEFPSPTTPTVRLNRMKLNGTPDGYKFNQSNDSLQNFNQSSEDFHRPRCRPVQENGDFRGNIVLSDKKKSRIRNRNFDLNETDGTNTMAIHNELKTFDITITDEMSDCMKLFSRAEKNVSSQNERRANSFDGASKNVSSTNTRQARSFEDSIVSTAMPTNDDSRSGNKLRPLASDLRISLIKQSTNQDGCSHYLASPPDPNLFNISEATFLASPECSAQKNGLMNKSLNFNRPLISYGSDSNQLLSDNSSQEFEQSLRLLEDSKKKVEARKESMAYFESVFNEDTPLSKSKALPSDNIGSGNGQYPDLQRFGQEIEDSKALISQARSNRPLSAFDAQSAMTRNSMSTSRPNSAPIAYNHGTESFTNFVPTFNFSQPPHCHRNHITNSVIPASNSFVSSQINRPEFQTYLQPRGSAATVKVAEASSSSSSQTLEQSNWAFYPGMSAAPSVRPQLNSAIHAPQSFY